MTGICRQLHSNLPAKLARLTSYHEAKPLKLLKTACGNVDKKNFHLSIKITPFLFFADPNIITKDLWSSSKYNINMNSTKFHFDLFFSKPCVHVLRKIITTYKFKISKCILFKYISISYIKFINSPPIYTTKR